MEDIIISIQAFKEDNPHIIITEDMIKEIIQENIDKIVEEIEECL